MTAGPLTELGRLVRILRRQGLRRTAWAGLDKAVRWTTGGPMGRFARITDAVWLGGQPGARGRARLMAAGVTGFVNLRSEFDYARLMAFDGVRYLHLPTADDEAPSLAHLAQGATFMREEVAAGGRVYIHCWEGLGRGPTLVAAYFVSTGMTPEAAWDRVRAVRPFIQPTAVQEAQLRAFAAAFGPR